MLSNGSKRCGVSRVQCFVVIALTLMPLIRPTDPNAQVRDVVGVITELKPGRGIVEFQPAGAIHWRPATPLLALRAGDKVRVTEDAAAVVLLAGGRGSVKLDSASSLLSVPALPPAEGVLRRGANLLQRSFGSLSVIRPDTYVETGVRGDPSPPIILFPRDGSILPGELQIEWSGGRAGLYTITVIDPNGVQVQRASLQGLTFTYPSTGPVLSAGVRYRVQVTTGLLPSAEVWFEILGATRAGAVRQDVADVTEAAGGGVPRPTVAVLQAIVLADQNLLSNARQLVVAALKSDPDEPSLHLLLGDLYKRMGLAEQAAESFEEAELLGKRK